MLHMVNQSPFRSCSFETCLRFVQPDDAILLTEDGIYAAQSGTAFAEKTANAMAKNEVYVLEPDLKARGVSNLLEGVKKVDYDGFVGLVEKHQVNSWL